MLFEGELCQKILTSEGGELFIRLRRPASRPGHEHDNEKERFSKVEFIAVIYTMREAKQKNSLKKSSLHRRHERKG